MSLYDYQRSREIDNELNSFASLIMAAMRRADTANTAKLKAAFPEIYDELQTRYHSPGGMLPAEHTQHVLNEALQRRQSERE